MATKDNAIQQLAATFLSGNTTDTVDIITFVESPWGLGFKLYPVQKFLLKAYYGMPLDDRDRAIEVPDEVNDKLLYKFTETEFLHWLKEEGRCNTDVVEGKQFRELLLVLGRRSGKSTLASCVSNYEIYKLVKRDDPSAYYSYPPDTVISILNVAPTDEQAGIVFNMIQSMALNCAYLRDRSVNQTQTYFNIRTDADIRHQVGTKKRASIMSIAGGCSSNALRGRNAIVVIMDEFAFFINNDGRFSGSEVYKALTPSTGTFRRDGKIVTISNPYAKFGAFWDRYNQSFEEEDTTLMFQMYTAMVNRNIDPTILKTERRRDKVSFSCEFGAEFSDSIVAWIDDEEQFKQCLVDRPIPSRGVVGTQYYVGLDLGLKNDGTAIVVVHREGKKIVLDYANVWYSGSADVWDMKSTIYRHCGKYKDQPILQMNDIVSEIQELSKWFPIRAGLFDQHHGYGLMERLHDVGMKQFEMVFFTDALNNKVFQLVKTLYQDGMLELFRHPVLIPELMMLEGEKRSKNKVIVAAPPKKGAHDDLSDAFVRAVWACFNDSTETKPKVTSLAGAGAAARGQAATMKSFLRQRIKQHGASRKRSMPKKRSRFSVSMTSQSGVRR